MIAPTVKQAKLGFFDRQAVIDAADRPTRDVLSKFGAFVMVRAKSSIRYNHRVSKPGNPPYAHGTMTRPRKSAVGKTAKSWTVSPLREFIFFSFDAPRKSVVIGPVRLNARSGEALPALEYGGLATIRSHGRPVKARIRARPFMVPAFNRELPGVPDMWKNAIKK